MVGFLAHSARLNLAIYAILPRFFVLSAVKESATFGHVAVSPILHSELGFLLGVQPCHLWRQVVEDALERNWELGAARRWKQAFILEGPSEQPLETLTAQGVITWSSD